MCQERLRLETIPSRSTEFVTTTDRLIRVVTSVTPVPRRKTSMRSVRGFRAIPAIGLGFALSIPLISLAQGPPISSGSGSGTGTGRSSSSLGATGTGSESSTGLGTTGTGREGLPGVIGRPFRPGVPNDLTRPTDRNPRQPGQEGPPRPSSGLSVVGPQLFLVARSVIDPGERALALVRIAQTAIFSKQLEDAHIALFEAIPAALQERQPLIRQQRTVSVIDALLSLAEERMSSTTDLLGAAVDNPSLPPSPPVDANPGSNNPGGSFDARTPVAALPDESRQTRLQVALPEWAMAVDMARRLEDVTARTEALFRIVESEAFSSQRLITDPIRGANVGGRPDPSSLPPDLRAYTDQLLANSAQHAAMIERPIWRNYATYSIVSNAATSSQFARGFEIARALDQPEARTNVLIRLAEGQALNGRPTEATAAYAEAARAVALIPQSDPRETLVGVLIDSLISFGRFEDAKSCIRLYVTRANQVVAYSAIAESQGRRGLAESARTWIAREIAPEYQALMYRKVNDGMLTGIKQNRSKDLSSSGN